MTGNAPGAMSSSTPTEKYGEKSQEIEVGGVPAIADFEYSAEH